MKAIHCRCISTEAIAMTVFAFITFLMAVVVVVLYQRTPFHVNIFVFVANNKHANIILLLYNWFSEASNIPKTLSIWSLSVWRR